MRNWMIELEKHMNKEDAKLVVQLVAGATLVASIIVGNWNLFIQ